MVRVSSGGFKSDPFLEGTGIKQGCVIAPSIFNLLRIAKQNINPADGVQISYRLDGNLFNLRRLQAKTLVTVEAIHKLQYAFDTVFVSSSPDGLQHTINAVAEAYSRSGLAINTGKTEVLNMCQPPIPALFINQQPLNNVDEFTYLESVLSNTKDLSSEVQRRIGLASASFGNESWVLYRRHLNKLEAFHTPSLQRILGVKSWHKVPHTEICNRACIDQIDGWVTPSECLQTDSPSWPPTDKVGKRCAVQDVNGSPPTSMGLQNSDAFVAMLYKMQEVTSPAMRVVASASPGLD
ncbi:uncharacterized protein [Penaeus vannamei]|uniref:uncharacterized protein n=1 Tax=Penaeus vannamei TaxID=6689 RepID=UPI00387F6149